MSFPSIRFRGELRPSQREVVEIARASFAAGERSLHVVAPPGSGKTVLGLFLWAECVRAPAVVLSPNSAIQAQWAARTDLFDFGGVAEIDRVSTDASSPGLLTSLTYQSITLPSRGDGNLDDRARERWIDRLCETDEAEDPEEARAWIEDLRRHNPGYYEQRLGAYRKEVRDERTRAGGSFDVLHESAIAALHRLRDHGVGLVVLDECHHLLGHWGRVLADAHEFLDGPIVVGLTATPPDLDGKSNVDAERYSAFFGEIDYEVPVPAVVRDGFLAPYQDLAYFVRPSADELRFVADADERLHAIVEQLCEPATETDTGAETESEAETNSVASSPRTLPEWVTWALSGRRLPTGAAADWPTFERRDPTFAEAGRLFLLRRGIEFPESIPPPDLDPEDVADVPEMTDLVPVLDRFVRHRLRRSPEKQDHRLAEEVTRRLRLLGVQITETGTQACASPVGRVLAYSHAKTAALIPILHAESAALGDRLRAIVVTDYEKTSAITEEVSHLLDAESGGAVAAFRTLLSDPITDGLDPILVTGSSVLVDDDSAELVDTAAADWLQDRGCEVELVFAEEDGFHVLNGRGRDWCPRVYVAMITDLFQRGITRCLVGTRGLLGEGWDANKVNVLIDLTTVTTSMSVNQLRGRSMRLDPDEPGKVANNWDVVCLAPEFAKGLDDYRRFVKKHGTLFGITDDSAIEKGVGHVHPAFTELKPERLEGSVAALNADMLARASQRDLARERWRIGEPYHAEPIRAVEFQPGTADTLEFPPFRGANDPWTDETLSAAVARAVSGALADANLVQSAHDVHIGERAGGYVRVFLEDASEEEGRLFAESMREVFGRLERPRYVIPRSVDRFRETWTSWLLPDVIGRFFRKRERETVMLHAVPSPLARNKDLVAIFERHWRQHVGPGEAVYAHHGSGRRMIEEARSAGRLPKGHVHTKDVFG